MCVIALALYVTVVTSPAWAAGAYLYENGTPDLGTAAAGRDAKSAGREGPAASIGPCTS